MKRFDPIGRPYTKAMIIDDLGNYVLYSDYEKLEAEKKELIELLEYIKNFADREIRKLIDDKLKQ